MATKADPLLAEALFLPSYRATYDEAAVELYRRGVRHPGYLSPGNLSPVALGFLAALGQLLVFELLEGGKVSLRTTPERITRLAMRELEYASALGVLAAIAPNVMVPQGPAKDMGRACTALVAREMPQFLGNIFARWVEDGFLIDVDRGPEAQSSGPCGCNLPLQGRATGRHPT